MLMLTCVPTKAFIAIPTSVTTQSWQREMRMKIYNNKSIFCLVLQGEMLPGQVLTLSFFYKLYLNKITQKFKAHFSSSCIDWEKSPNSTGTFLPHLRIKE